MMENIENRGRPFDAPAKRSPVHAGSLKKPPTRFAVQSHAYMDSWPGVLKVCRLGSFRCGVEGAKKSPQVEVPVHG